VVGERDALISDKARLEERVRLLEASSQSLDAERTRLIDEMEDLRQAHERLDRDVARLRAAEAQLTESLTAREAELASRSEEVGRLRSTYQGLVADLEAEVADGQIEIEQLRDGLQLSLTQEVLFAIGSAQVNPSGRKVLAKVARRLREIPHRVVVEGHSDNVPIHSEVYPTNWELAGARASGVVRLLAEQGVDPARLSAISYGEFKPRASNATPEGRAKNRRIEISLQPLDRNAPAAEAEGAETAAGP
jgi:chemotaxis protein MotB